MGCGRCGRGTVAGAQRQAGGQQQDSRNGGHRSDFIASCLALSCSALSCLALLCSALHGPFAVEDGFECGLSLAGQMIRLIFRGILAGSDVGAKCLGGVRD